MKREKAPDKLFIVRKYIMAQSAEQAIKKERNHAPDDVWMDDDWRNADKKTLAENSRGKQITGFRPRT